MKPWVAVGRIIFAGDNLPQRLIAGLLVRNMAPVRAWQTSRAAAAAAVGEQRLGLPRRLVRVCVGIGVLVPLSRRAPRIPCVVVNALSNQNDISNAEVESESNRGRCEAGEESACRSELAVCTEQGTSNISDARRFVSRRCASDNVQEKSKRERRGCR